jgi:hypothetical protein
MAPQSPLACLHFKAELMAGFRTCRCGHRASSRRLAASTLASRPQASRDRSSSRQLTGRVAQQWQR